jgi:hypothetical protein
MRFKEHSDVIIATAFFQVRKTLNIGDSSDFWFGLEFSSFCYLKNTASSLAFPLFLLQ